MGGKKIRLGGGVLTERLVLTLFCSSLCDCVTNPREGEVGRVQNLEFDESHLERVWNGLKKVGSRRETRKGRERKGGRGGDVQSKKRMGYLHRNSILQKKKK